MKKFALSTTDSKTCPVPSTMKEERIFKWSFFTQGRKHIRMECYGLHLEWQIDDSLNLEDTR
jgi:hypothetical protein